MFTLKAILRLLQMILWSIAAFTWFGLKACVLFVCGGQEGRRVLVRRAAARTFRVYLQTLGATFIKVGQILSTRPDILPEYVISELAQLQDNVPPVSFEKIQHSLELELGAPVDTVFSDFSRTPIASASVAQVYQTTLSSGEAVAVKIRRPGIIEQVKIDTGILLFIARVISLVPALDVLSPLETMQEFCQAVADQMDFRKEAENNQRFQAIFERDAEIHVPELYPQWCSDSVLVMEFVHGVKDNAIDTYGLDRRKLARIGVRAIMTMVYDHGFVHADLHPGNILFRANHHVFLIDLGMVGSIDDEHRHLLAATILAVATNDGATVARMMYDGSPRPQVSDYERYESDVTELVARIHRKSIMELEVSLLVGAVFEILRRHKLRANASFTTINIAMLVVEGLGKKLDPSMNMFEVMQPYLFKSLANAPKEYRIALTQQMAKLGSKK